MRAENVNPFLLSVQEFFDTMLGCSAEGGQVGVPEKAEGPPNIIGLIGLSGDAKGLVAVKMPVPTALAIVSRMVGEELKSVTSSVVDGVGEFVNIVAGSAKAKFEGQRLSLSLPTVVRGDLCKLSNQFQASWIEISFTSELGDFSVAVAFSTEIESSKETSNASVSRG